MAKKALTITLYVSEILVQVKNKAFLTGRSRDNGNNNEEVAHMQASDDDEDEMQLLNSIGNAFATLKSKLSEFLTLTATTSDNVLIDGETNLSLALSLPSNYNQSTADAIARGCDQYLVNMALSEWFNITNKADAEGYLNKAAADLAIIREAAHKRVRPVRTDPTATSGSDQL